MSEAQPTERKNAPSSNLWVDVGPIAIWILVYNVGRRIAKDDAIYWATGAFMVAAVIALFIAVREQKRIPPMLAFSAAVVVGFGSIGIILQDPIFIYIKPTVINFFYSVIILLGLAFRFNVWKFAFGSMFTLPDEIWTTLAIRWALWFQFQAFLNELLWRHITDTVVPESARWFAEFSITEDIWSNSKLVLIFAAMAFMVANFPLVRPYMDLDKDDDDEAETDKVVDKE